MLLRLLRPWCLYSPQHCFSMSHQHSWCLVILYFHFCCMCPHMSHFNHLQRYGFHLTALVPFLLVMWGQAKCCLVLPFSDIKQLDQGSIIKIDFLLLHFIQFVLNFFCPMRKKEVSFPSTHSTFPIFSSYYPTCFLEFDTKEGGYPRREMVISTDGRWNDVLDSFLYNQRTCI